MNYAPSRYPRIWYKTDVNRGRRLHRKNLQKAANKYNLAISQEDLRLYQKYSGITLTNILLAFITAFGIGFYNGSWAIGFLSFIFIMAIFSIFLEEKDKA